jgi:hypothetical protein
MWGREKKKKESRKEGKWTKRVAVAWERRKPPLNSAKLL